MGVEGGVLVVGVPESRSDSDGVTFGNSAGTLLDLPDISSDNEGDAEAAG